MTKEEKYKAVEEKIKLILGEYLFLMGYKYANLDIVPSMNNSEYLDITFNKDDSIVLDFHYWISDFRNVIWESISIHLQKIPYRPYILEEILNCEKISFESSMFCLLNYEGDFEQQVETFCKVIVDLFENKIKTWIQGEKWIDIPFDWGDYK